MADGKRPQAVLFACGHNTVRSPMAESIFKYLFGSSTYAVSAGVRAYDLAELTPDAVERSARRARTAMAAGRSAGRFTEKRTRRSCIRVAGLRVK